MANTQTSTNVVPLPTAAARKVRQRWSKVRKADMDALLRFPQERSLSPYQRKALNEARILCEIEPSPAMTFASAIWRVLDETQKSKVRIYLAMAQSREGEQALAWIDFLTANYGDRSAISWAMNRLDRGEIQ